MDWLKTQLLPIPPAFGAPPLNDSIAVSQDLWHRKTRVHRLRENMFSRYDSTTACERHTDGHTDTGSFHIGYSVNIPSHMQTKNEAQTRVDSVSYLLLKVFSSI